MADWPMPDSSPFSSVQATYDTSDPEVVVDEITGLIWQRKLPSCYNVCSGDNATPRDSCSLDEAIEYCRTIRLGEHTCRLPSQIDLLSIVDTHQATRKPTWNNAAFGEGAPSGPFWTSSVRFGFPEEVAVVNKSMAATVEFVFGTTGAARRTLPHLVRCVSAGKVADGLPSERYNLDPENGSITDTRTQLTWATTALPATESWEQSKRLCSQLGPGYRVARYKELVTIFDLTNSLPAYAPIFRGTNGGNAVWTGDRTEVGGGYVMEEFTVISMPEIVYRTFRANLEPSNPVYNAPYAVRCVQ